MDYKLNLGHSLDGMSLPWGNASNGHIALLGQSGRGKSYAIKHFLSQLPEQGVHAYIFDCSGDFRESSKQEILKSTRTYSMFDSKHGLTLFVHYNLPRITRRKQGIPQPD